MRAQARTISAAVPTRAVLAGLEEAGRRPSSGAWKLPLVVAAVLAVGLGGVWLKTRYRAVPAAPKPQPVALQPAAAPAPAPAANSDLAATGTPVTGGTVTPAPAAAGPAPDTTTPSKPAETAQKPAPEKAAPAPQVKPQPAAVTSAAAKPPAATLTAPANLEVKGPAPVSVPVPARQQEPPPKTMVSVPAAAAARMPDLPKPEVPAAGVLRQSSLPVAAQLLQSVPPVYPPTAKALRLQGVVRVSAKVSPQGRVTEVTWISGNSFFRDSAVSAVKQWRYKPATLDGQPVESVVEIVLKFNPQ